MDMPAFSVRNKVTLDKILKTNITERINSSFSNSEEMDKLTRKIISTPAVNEAVKKLSKE